VEYLELLPHPALRDAIQCYWFLRGSGQDAPPQRVLPDGCCELVFHCTDTFTRATAESSWLQPHGLLVGPTTRAIVITPGADVDVVGIRFRPGGAALLRSLPMQELTNCAISHDDAGIRFSHDLLADVAATRGTRQRVRQLDRMLLARVDGTRFDQPMLAAGKYIGDRGGAVRSAELARLCGLSVRQLQRRFQAATGVSVKQLCRLTRLQTALAAAHGPAATLAGIAAIAGYADQAHFNRDFRDIAGVTPTEFFRQDHELTDHFFNLPSM
jgi:AraC-like DNA-binding protein